MDTEIRENDLLGDIEQVAEQLELEQNNPLFALQQSIAAMPAVDAERVEAVRKKLLNGTLDILGDAASQEASAQRIAKQIMQESSLIDLTVSDPAATEK